jgi:predicted transcriptional regulator
MRIIALAFGLLLMSGCSTVYPNKDITGQVFPEVVGQSLEKKSVTIPNDFSGEITLLLIGYVQNSQFDIDRWLIGLDMTQTKVNVYEIPTIQGLFPQMFSTFIDNGMRSGIPKPLWKGVITVYEDGDKVQALTGNEKSSNARVVLLDKKGKILYFYDQGFAVDALNQVRDAIDAQ